MIVFFGNTLNRHQAFLADEFYRLTDGAYRYVEVVPPTTENAQVGGKSTVELPYVLQAFGSPEDGREAMRLAREAEIALFGAFSLPYEVERMRTTGGVAFEVSERWLKRGVINVLSPRLLKNMWYYHTLFKNRPLYKLCSSAYAANDQYRLHSFKDRCYKWGYFTEVKELDIEAVVRNRGKGQVETSPDVSTARSATILWCARFLQWKHPELPIRLVRRLKDNGYDVHLDMYGTGPELQKTQSLCAELDVRDRVTFRGNVPNDEVLAAMQGHDIFLFTSDRNEGWGAVLNEAMSNGCTVVASEAIGSVPFLVENGRNGMVYRSQDLDTLYEKTVFLIEHPEDCKAMAIEAYHTMHDSWSPRQAAENLIKLADDLMHGRETSMVSGPCSKAFPVAGSRSRRK